VLAKRLLKSHKVALKDTEVDTIVDYFTEKLYSHQYFIGRKEAREDLGLKTVVDADASLSKIMTDLWEEYGKELDFGKMWSPENELGLNAVQTAKNYKIAYIEAPFFQTTTTFPSSTANSKSTSSNKPPRASFKFPKNK